MAMLLDPPIGADCSPFSYQSPLQPYQVLGRDGLVEDVAERLRSHRVTAVCGPRRYGKTSLLRRVFADLEFTGMSSVWVDLYALSSVSDLAARIDAGLCSVEPPLRQALARAASSLSLELGDVTKGLRRNGRRRCDPQRTILAQVEALVLAASEVSVVVAFDEFAAITRVDGAAGLLRTALQRHYTNLGIVFAGSELSIMHTMFSDRDEPFYGQADLVEVKALEPEAIRTMVEDGFSFTDRRAGSVADRIVELAAGHPQRSMQLADSVWRFTPPGATASDETWNHAVEAIRLVEADSFESLHSALNPGQQKVLRSLAHFGTVYGTGARLHDLAKGTATEARRSLQDHGHLMQEGGTWSVVDPFFADWIRQRFPL